MTDLSLWCSKVYNALSKRGYIKRKQKTYQDWLDRGYVNEPLVSFIIQSHNKSIQVLRVVSKLRTLSNIEIIVIDDGSKAVHLKRLSQFMVQGNEFVIRANDLYENVMYDKALRLANGKYIVLMQDDDDFDTLEWIDDAVNLFDKYPNMVILGGCGGYRVQFDKVNEIVSVHLDGQGTNLKFVPTVDRAPMWVNRQLFLQKLHHIDYSFAPFMCDDHELCLRAWLNGLSVGWYKCPFKSLSAGGMRIWNNSLAGELAQKNYRKLYQMYAAKETEINSLVEDANREILEEKSI